MAFPQLEDVQMAVKYCNGHAPFKRASEWADTKVLVTSGDDRFWFKLYRGSIIDVAEYAPLSNALGYDVLISGSPEGWGHARNGSKAWELLTVHQISMDGNLIEANRLHEALCIFMESFAENK